MLILGTKPPLPKLPWAGSLGRSRSRVAVVAVGLSVVAFSMGADAQTVPAPPAADAQVGFQHPAQLTPEAELAAADVAIARMEQGSASVAKMLEAARSARDIVKTLCLNDKLSQIDVAIRSAKDRRGALQSAVQRNDQELSNHEFTILTVLRQRSEQLAGEANQCIGEEAAFIGQTSVSMSVDNTDPSPDDTQPPVYTIITIPPGSATSDGK
jgi:hypothetical protein